MNDIAPVSVSYQSRGALLLYGSGDAVREAVHLLPSLFNVLVVSDEPDLALPNDFRGTGVSGEIVQLRGHLGRFRASVAGPDGLLDLGPLSPNGDEMFDLVLDLCERPLFETEVPPLGYARTRGDVRDLDRKIERLARLIGPVNKPRYFSFDQRRCAYDRQGLQGCRRCLESCPAGAIGVNEGRISIDPYLCQGCGSCTLVCPTGAIRYARPKPQISLQEIATVLEDTPTETDVAPVLAIHAGNMDIPEGATSLRVPTLGSVGMEIWISALSLGASRVLLVRSGLLPPLTARLLSEQVALSRELLRAVGVAPERIRIVNTQENFDSDGLPNEWRPIPLDNLIEATGKRQLIINALAHLANPARSKVRIVPLSGPDAFGTLTIDAKRCTLCHACVGLCPTAALHNPQGALSFVERDCVQCGLCIRGCPEKALHAEPRFNAPSAIAADEQILKSASEMSHCVSCGAPFAPTSLVEGSINQVRNHPMFQGEGLRLLRMCASCRQKSTAGLPL